MQQHLLQEQANVLNGIANGQIGNTYAELDDWWLNNIGWGVADVPPYMWGTFNAATECSSTPPVSFVCSSNGANFRINAQDLFYNMKAIGIDIHTSVGTGDTFYSWIQPPGQGFSAPGGNSVDPNNIQFYACFNPTIAGAQASVCWVCADVATQMLLRSNGYDLKALALADPYVGGNGQFKYPQYIARYTDAVAQFYRDHDRDPNGPSAGLVTGSFPFYNMGDSVILSNDPSIFVARPIGASSPGTPDKKEDTYHMGIVIKGGMSLDDILIAQNSYSAEGFFDSDVHLLLNSTVGLPPKTVGIGRFQVISLRTYLSQDAALGRHETIPNTSDPNYIAIFQQFSNDAVLHGIPQHP